MPHSIASASFLLLGIEVVGHVLDDGTRIVDADCVDRLIVAMGDPDVAAKIDLMELQRFEDWKLGRL